MLGCCRLWVTDVSFDADLTGAVLVIFRDSVLCRNPGGDESTCPSSGEGGPAAAAPGTQWDSLIITLTGFLFRRDTKPESRQACVTDRKNRIDWRPSGNRFLLILKVIIFK